MSVLINLKAFKRILFPRLMGRWNGGDKTCYFLLSRCESNNNNQDDDDDKFNPFHTLYNPLLATKSKSCSSDDKSHMHGLCELNRLFSLIKNYD
jgi:hypothetical protein